MKRNAFTLIELLVVIAILGILTVITVSQFGAAQKRSRDVARKADLNSLSKALLNYYADFGQFPAQADISWGGEFADSTGYIYMKRVPTENYQSQGNPEYCYQVTAELDKFALFSNLENNEDSEYNKYTGPYNFCGESDYNFVIMSPNAEIGDF